MLQIYLGNTTKYYGDLQTLSSNIETTCRQLGYTFTVEATSYNIMDQLICDIHNHEHNTITLDIRRFCTDRQLYINTYNIFMFHLHAKGNMEEIRYYRNIYALPPVNN